MRTSRYRILAEARDDLDRAAAWYDEQLDGLGLELVLEFRERLEWALVMEGAGAPVGETPGGALIRRYRFRRFRRHAILMATMHRVPTVIALEHSSRKPEFWRTRLL